MLAKMLMLILYFERAYMPLVPKPLNGKVADFLDTFENFLLNHL